MDLKTCKFCRKVHRGFGALCPACTEDLDKKYLTIRNYLDKNRNTSPNVSALAQATEVDQKTILYLIREGRIVMSSDEPSIRCMKCGAQISTGKYCDKCKAGLVRELEQTKSTMTAQMAPARPEPAQSADKGSKVHILRDDR